MKKNDFDFIASKFDNENIKAPDELSEENIKAALDKDNNKIIKFQSSKKRVFTGAISIAAALAIVVVSLTAVNHFGSKNPVSENKKDNNGEVVQSNEKVDGITYFSSYDEINELIEERSENNGESKFIKNGGLVYENAKGLASDSAAAPSSSSYSQTYKQVDAVDEADIVKTDGEYIYYKYISQIIIKSAKDGKTKKVSKIELPEDKIPEEFFISGNSLIVVSTKSGYDEEEDSFTSSTIVSTYDITNKKKPKLENEYTQSGYYSSSRMIGDCIYIVSNFGNHFFVKNGCIPYATNEEGEYKKLPAESICAIDDSSSSNYAVIGAVNTKDGSNAGETKAIIGSSSDIYCNESNLYVVGVNYDYSKSYYETKSTVVKIAFDKTDIKIKSTCSFKGTVYNQFAMDEKDGYFRVAATYQNKDGNNVNALHIFDSNLKETGSVEGFAKNEHIEAVKYIGDMAYVITYEQIDPLFIIDLSNPKKPKILGEVEITGFSTLLVPIDEKTLLGIGYATEENEFGEGASGLKLALFDISNPKEPKIKDEHEIDGCSSSAQYDHKALVINKEKGYFAVPADFNDYETAGALVFSVNNGKISVDKEYKSDKVYDPERCVYIGDFIYVIDTYENQIDSFEMK